ncbi:MAG: cytoskeleton protein RodZ [Halioglobus sp.]|jgi:cytoskeleton protein RodZ
MTSEPLSQASVPSSPGPLLKHEREAQGMSQREAADRLNWMPDYVAVIEDDNYEKLRNPAFARGYVKAYARLVGLSEELLLSAFDEHRRLNVPATKVSKKRQRPVHLQRTEIGVAVGLGVLLLLVFFMWWRSA